MSKVASPETGKPYGLAAVCRAWRIARSGIYRHRTDDRRCDHHRCTEFDQEPSRGTRAASISAFPSRGHTAGNSPFFRRLAAVRCAFRCVRRCGRTLQGGSSAQSDVQGLRWPIRGRRQRRPLRMTKMIPLMTRRSSTCGMPCDSGKNGRMRRSRASDNQNRSLIAELLPPFRNHVRPRRSKNFNGS